MLKRFLRSSAAPAAALLLCAVPACAAGADSLRDARQLLLVTTAGWDSTTALLRRFERASAGTSWREVGEPMPAVVGRNGLGWGRGLNATQGEGPRKHEGDGRAPAGIFSLGPAFGYAPPSSDMVLRLPYLQLTSAVECVDDMESASYNTIIDTGRAARDWKSSEAMAHAGVFYRWGVVVHHNADPVVVGDGSCIFIHCWGGATVATSGCTALEESNVVALLRWLDADRAPLLVQLPASEIGRLGPLWGLPPVR